MEKKSKIQFIVDELDRLQDSYYEEHEEALYYKNKYHECQARYTKINDEIENKIKELHEIDPTYEYQVEVY